METNHKSSLRCFYLLFTISALLFGCAGSSSNDSSTSDDISNTKEITAFSFVAANNSALASNVTCTISGTNISCTVPYETDVTALVATLSHTGNSINAGDVAQFSGQTALDFTDAVTITVTAADGTTKDYVVTVIAAASDEKAINLFTFLEVNNSALSSDVNGTIDENEKTISLTVPYGTMVTALVPTIVIVGSSVSPANETAIDFSSPVTYTVTATDETTQDYTVTVTVTAVSAKEITSFAFTAAVNSALSSDITATISGTDITATVPYGTSVTALVATFTTTGDSVSVDGTSQSSGKTANDFSSAVTYTVTAADATTQTYSVTVTVAAASAGDSVNYTAGSVSFTMVYVPGGITYMAGENDDGDKNNDGDTVDSADEPGGTTISSSYLIAQTEVTYELWNAVYTWATSNGYTFANAGVQGNDGSGNSYGTTQHPVTVINWRDAMVWMNAFTEYYNDQNGTSLTCAYHGNSIFTDPIRDSSDTAYGSDYGSEVNTTAGSFDNPYVNSDATGFRLLTSDEWELAARYITDDGDNILDKAGEYYPGNYASGADAQYDATTGGSDIDSDGDIEYTTDVAVYAGNSGGTTVAVKSKSPNALGIYDMNGSVFEWVFDLSEIDPRRTELGNSFQNWETSMLLGREPSNYPYVEDDGIGIRFARKP